MVVRVDGAERFRTNLPNLDGGYAVNNEYNVDIPVSLPEGKHLIEVANAGSDWFFLDWARLERVLPAGYAGGWEPSPEALGLRGKHESLLYVVAVGASFPGGGTNAVLPLWQGDSVVLTNWPAGTFAVEWFYPATGTRVAQASATTTNGNLTLALPDFREDLAGVLRPSTALKAVGITTQGEFQFLVESEPGAHYIVEQSSDLSTWVPYAEITNSETSEMLSEPMRKRAAFFRTTSAIEP